MKYKVVIRPIATDIEIVRRGFATEQEAWTWVEENNIPVVDYDVVPDSSPEEQPNN